MLDCFKLFPEHLQLKSGICREPSTELQNKIRAIQQKIKHTQRPVSNGGKKPVESVPSNKIENLHKYADENERSLL